MGITRNLQWKKHITSAQMRDLWGDQETVDMKIAKRRLEQLGHVARMPDHCMPKMALFGWLQKTRPPRDHEKDGKTSSARTCRQPVSPKNSGTGQLSHGKDGVPSTRDCRAILARRNKRNHLSNHTSEVPSGQQMLP